MRGGLILALAALMTTGVVSAQQPMAARANVTAYYDDAAVEKLAYRESPYYQELTGSWQQIRTDSSTRYSRELDVEKDWREFKVFLNVRGGREVRVLLNGQELGYEEDSRHWNEFLLDPALKYGKSNTLTIETMKHSRGALLEDSVLEEGMNGTPYILFKNDPNIADFSLVADYDVLTGAGSLTVLADVFCGKRKGKYYIEVEVWDSKGHVFDRMGRWVVFNGRSEELVEMSRMWTDITPWNAESPVLYTAVVRLRDEQMAEEETVGAKFGFRRVEVKDGQLLVNGKAVTMKGVVYGLEHTEGHAAREQMKNAVFAMKRMNVNAVRTARFSPVDPYFYELCDQYGLYVVCDANLLPLSEQHMAVATDREYLPLFERRVENLYGKYKNHTSIIAWSLGNSKDNGVCMTGAYRRLKAIDKTRPVIFSGADHGESTDIIAPSYPETNALKQDLAKQSSRPYLMMSTVDGEHFQGHQSLWQLVKKYRQLQGGFVDAWPLNKSMQNDLKHLYSPFGISVSKLTADEGEFVVSNNNDFNSFGQYTLEYNIYTPSRPNITGGELAVAVPAGGMDKVGMLIPDVKLRAGEDLYVQFDLKTRRSSRQEWQQNEDMGRGTVQLPLAKAKRTSSMLHANSRPVQDSLDNRDMIPQKLFFAGHEDWKAICVERQVRRLDATTLCIDQLYRYTSVENRPMCTVQSTYTLFGTGDVVVDYKIVPTVLKRSSPLQPVISIPYGLDSLTWYGLDREVLFDTNHSGLMGIYGHVSDNLRRRDVRWCALHASEQPALFVEMLGDKCHMAASKKGVELQPSNAKNLRLHMRLFTEGAPAEFAGCEFPHTAMELPIAVDTVRQTSLGRIVSTTFSRKPNTPYNLGADTILFDGETGDVEDLSRNWLGFSGSNLQVLVKLSESTPVESITLRFAHNPSVWAFAPQSVSVSTSTDGTVFGPSQTVLPEFDPAVQDNATPQVVVMVVPIKDTQAEYVRVEFSPLPQLPAWHRGKGLKPWLMIDELEVMTAGQ